MEAILKSIIKRIGLLIALSLATACSNIGPDPTDTTSATTQAGSNQRRVASWDAKSSGKRIFSATYDYDSSGRLIGMVKSIYNVKTGEVKSTIRTRISYDAKGRISTIAESGTANVAYANRSFSYDDQGNVIKQVMTLNDPYVMVPMEYTYQDKKLRQISSRMDIQKFSWSSSVISQMTGDGYGYSYAYNQNGKCTSMKVSKPAVRNVYEYNERNELIRIKFYDEVKLAYTQDFAWEPGIGNFDISDVSFSLSYDFGVFKRYGIP